MRRRTNYKSSQRPDFRDGDGEPAKMFGRAENRDRFEVEVFHGHDDGTVTVFTKPSPGGCDAHAIVLLNRAAAGKIKEIEALWIAAGGYDLTPETYESEARRLFRDSCPELLAANQYAKTLGVVMIEIHGLPTTSELPKTPLDGVVVENDVRLHLFNLLGSFASGWELTGFSYQGENGGGLLRAVCPVKALAESVSSQGFADDLGWHQDNADRTIPEVPDIHPGGRGLMNPQQAFFAVRPDVRTPMEAVALADLVDETVKEHGVAVLDQLMRPNFALDRPDSHGGGRSVEGVPVLVEANGGIYHGRFHASNVTGLTLPAQQALEAFKSTVLQTNAAMTVQLNPGSLLMYSNTRAMHRRRRYSARLDGTDRYFVRLYLASERALEEHAADIRGRTVG